MRLKSEVKEGRQDNIFGWFCHLWPTAKKDNGEPDTKEGEDVWIQLFLALSSIHVFHLYGGVDDHDEVDDHHTMVQMIL